MKPISFEGLRRFVRGHREKESESSQTFKRSNSFKRASLRKSLHKHEKVTLPNGLIVKTSALQRKESVSSNEERRDDGYSTDGGDATGSGAVAGGPKRGISYDQWVANAGEDDFLKNPCADESCPSTMSTNKLSSLDSGVRHSMESKKKCSVESNKRLSLDYRRVIGLETTVVRPDLSRCPETINRRSVESNFRRSVSTDAPVPPTRLKSLLGSPRVAPKHRDHSPSSSVGISAYSVHSTPNRNRVVLSQPMSAPSTPGKQIQRVLQHQRPSHHTPALQPLRSSIHERERFCAVHGSPALQRVQLQERQSTTALPVNSPKPQNRWSAMFSNSIFSRSPVRKSQTMKANLRTRLSSENLTQVVFQQNDSSMMQKEKVQIMQHNYNSPKLHRSIHSSNNSPAPSRSHAVNIHPSIPASHMSMDAKLGIVRAMGGPRPLEENVSRNNSYHQGYQSPHVMQRNLSQPAQFSQSPVLMHRQSSAPTPEVNSPVCHIRPVSSPPPALPPPNGNRIPNEVQQPILNSSQFYPGKLVTSSLVSGLPSVSIVGGRSLSSDRCSSRNNSQGHPTPTLRTLSAERPRTPGISSRLSVPSWGRPFSLALGCAQAKADLLSPASMTSETSNRSDRRKRGPSLLVGKASWFSRNSAARKSFRLSNRNKKMEIVEFPEELEEHDTDIPPPPPPRPARLIAPDDYKKMREQNAEAGICEPVFIPPQKRKPTAPVKFPMSLWRKNNISEIRSTHADLLMPLSQPSGSRIMLDGRSEKTEHLVQSLLQDNEHFMDHNDDRDTNSEPGGARFSVVPKVKPKSVPSTTRMNVKMSKNPEQFLKALGFDSKKNRRRSQMEKDANLVGEQIITQLLLEQLSSNSKINSQVVGEKMAPFSSSNLPIKTIYEVAAGLESPSESLSSLVSSVISSRASNCSKSKKGKKVRRKKSHKRVPSVPTYPSWKKTQKGVGATVAAARDENGTKL